MKGVRMCTQFLRIKMHQPSFVRELLSAQRGRELHGGTKKVAELTAQAGVGAFHEDFSWFFYTFFLSHVAFKWILSKIFWLVVWMGCELKDTIHVLGAEVVRNEGWGSEKPLDNLQGYAWCLPKFLFTFSPKLGVLPIKLRSGLGQPAGNLAPGPRGSLSRFHT